MAKATHLEMYAGRLIIRMDDGTLRDIVRESNGRWILPDLGGDSTKPTPKPPSTGGGSATGWKWPFPLSTTTTPFGHYSDGTPHYGIDLGLGTKDKPVHACGPGTVMYSGWECGGQLWGGGNSVIINHGKVAGHTVFSQYAHMRDAVRVKNGQKVTSATVLGIVGTTGNSFGEHLHFQINYGNPLGNQYAVDPKGLMRAVKATGG